MATQKKMIVIKDIEKSSFSRACLMELKAEGVKEGDILVGDFNPINKAVDFKSPKTGIDCMAWMGITCEQFKDRFEENIN